MASKSLYIYHIYTVYMCTYTHPLYKILYVYYIYYIMIVYTICCNNGIYYCKHYLVYSDVNQHLQLAKQYVGSIGFYYKFQESIYFCLCLHPAD